MELEASSTNQADASASEQYSDDNGGMILDDEDDEDMRPPPPSSPSMSGSESVKSTEATNDVENFRPKENSVVTINPTPSCKPVTRAPSASNTITAPKSILKKKRSETVTPAPQAQDIARTTHFDESSSDEDENEEREEATIGSIPFVTPIPGHDNQSKDKLNGTDLLAKLNQVAEGSTDRFDTRRVEDHVPADTESQDDESDVFEDPTNEELGDYEFQQETPQEIVEIATSQERADRFPSIHDVFYGVHDDEEFQECSFEEMEAIHPSNPKMNPLLAILHDFFFRDACDTDVDDCTISMEDMEQVKVSPGTLTTSFLSVSALIVMALVFLCMLPLAANDISRTGVPIPKRALAPTNTNPFTNELTKEDTTLKEDPRWFSGKIW